MKNKSIIFILLVLISAVALSNFNLYSVSAASEKSSDDNVCYISADYEKDYSLLNLEEEFDYSFKGKVISYISTSQYNGHGTNIPYTYFQVEVLEVKKGLVDDEIIIKFYGGYDSENVLMLLENMSYPQLDEIYQFYCFKTNLRFSDDGRTIDNSYLITMECNMMKLNSLASDETTSTTVEDPYGISIMSLSPNINIEPGPGGGGTVNDSFERAYDISINTSREFFVADFYDRYFKITRNTLDYISVYSTGNVDANVSVYDSSQNLLYTDDNNDFNMYTSYTATGKNFFLNFYADKDTTYYIKVSLSSGDSGEIEMFVMRDNWAKTPLSDLIWEYDGVDINMNVDYKNESKYVNEIAYATAEWNKLGIVTFRPATDFTKDIIISDIYNSDPSAPFATTTYRSVLAMTVEYNTYFMDDMTYNRRIKTVLHEFGHVLGLDEFTNLEDRYTNVMHQGDNDITRLGPADIAVYRCKWGWPSE